MCNLGELNWLKHSSKDKWSCIVGGRVFFCLFNLSEQPKGRMQCNFDNTEIIFSFEMNRPRLKRALSGFFSLWNKSSASTPCANVQVAGYSIFVTAQLCGFQKLGAELSCAWCSFNLVLKATQVCCCSRVHFLFWLGVSLYFSSQKSLSARVTRVRVKASNLEHVVRCRLNLSLKSAML